MSMLVFNIKKNGIESVHASIMGSKFHLKVFFIDGTVYMPTYDGIDINISSIGKMLEALQAVQSVLLENGVISERRG